MTLDDMPAIVNIGEAAEVARVDRRLVSQAVHRGELRALVAGRTVRITREALKAWLMGEDATAPEPRLSGAIRPTNGVRGGRPIRA